MPWILFGLTGVAAWIWLDHRPKLATSFQASAGKQYRYTVEITPVVNAEILNVLGLLASSFGGTFHGLSAMAFSDDTTTVTFDMTLPQTRTLSTGWMSIGTLHKFRIVRVQPL